MPRAAKRPTKRTRRPPATTLLRRWGVVAVVAIVAYLYYHPLRTYLSTRGELARSKTEVAQLTASKRDLQQRLAIASSPDALAREARQLGYVRPGEHLYIVKGIQAWLAHQATIVERGGRP
ncbi:MAG TPA: septum formation initiator family protein [Gaiellaceae bacterium]|nr:septum formation initiator family protein [Gaiellaceae bacterium]